MVIYRHSLEFQLKHVYCTMYLTKPVRVLRVWNLCFKTISKNVFCDVIVTSNMISWSLKLFQILEINSCFLIKNSTLTMMNYVIVVKYIIAIVFFHIYGKLKIWRFSSNSYVAIESHLKLRKLQYAWFNEFE